MSVSKSHRNAALVSQKQCRTFSVHNGEFWDGYQQGLKVLLQIYEVPEKKVCASFGEVAQHRGPRKEKYIFGATVID